MPVTMLPAGCLTLTVIKSCADVCVGDAFVTVDVLVHTHVERERSRTDAAQKCIVDFTSIDFVHVYLPSFFYEISIIRTFPF